MRIYNRNMFMMGAPTARREYKDHRNGRGILNYECKQCGFPLSDINERSSKKEICDSCVTANRKLRERMRYWKNKVAR